MRMLEEVRWSIRCLRARWIADKFCGKDGDYGKQGELMPEGFASKKNAAAYPAAFWTDASVFTFVFNRCLIEYTFHYYIFRLIWKRC